MYELVAMDNLCIYRLCYDLFVAANNNNNSDMVM